MKGRIIDSVFNVKRNHMTWIGAISPTPISSKYIIKIDYMERKSPKIFILEPTLEVYQDRSLPHVYDQKKQRLCLYLPRSGEWDSTMNLAFTVIPWVSEWLLFYELWLVTGEWLGGGIHPESSKKEEASE